MGQRMGRGLRRFRPRYYTIGHWADHVWLRFPGRPLQLCIMKKRIVLLVLLVIATPLAFLGYANRVQIATRLVQLQHADSAKIGDYRVPVPDAWLVTEEMGGTLTLVATNAEQHETAFPNITITTVGTKSSAPRDLNAWKSSQRQLLESKGLKDLEERTIHFDGETVLCLGGNEVRDIWQFPNSSLMTLGCASTSSLNFMFVGPRSRLADFGKIVSQIHKNS